jgi:hypothetical protein
MASQLGKKASLAHLEIENRNLGREKDGTLDRLKVQKMQERERQIPREERHKKEILDLRKRE